MLRRKCRVIMRIEIATLFPEMCETVLSESIVGRARKKGLIELNCRNIRDYTQDKHRRVDDTPYGGGMGMVDRKSTRLNSSHTS